MTLTKKQQKINDKRVERAFYATCSGIPINILDIPRVFKAGNNAIKDGVDDETLRKVVRDFVESIRQD